MGCGHFIKEDIYVRCFGKSMLRLDPVGYWVDEFLLENEGHIQLKLFKMRVFGDTAQKTKE